jgi:FkbM family methyltransferase
MSKIQINSILYPYDASILLPSDTPASLHLPQKLIDSYSKLFNPGDVVYDIGAYIGYLSVPFALLGGIVHAFEGSSRNYTRLVKFCQHLRQIKCHNVVVSNKEEVVTDVFNDCTFDCKQEQVLNCVILQKYMNKNDLPIPKFIKLDIEGMETVALFGMDRLIVNKMCSWDIEVHKGMKKYSESHPGFLMPSEGGYNLNFFLELGYSAYDRNWNRVEDLYQSDEPTNYYLIP